MNTSLLLLKKIQSLCEQGQHFAHNEFDLQRYKEIELIVFELLKTNFQTQVEKIPLLMTEKNGYKTPKVDIRAVVFDDKHKILLVKEKADGKWSLPGGWADVGYTPTEIAIKETREEAGIEVDAGRLIAVLDKREHSHPEDLYYIYKIFIECIYVGSAETDFMETDDVDYFGADELPPLSTPRNTYEQISMMFDYHAQKPGFPILD
ncbi:MAG: NUDIX hydrolase N-terminal domain-containing protein [Bacteroidota bacterium]|nr:NUDIX hydrolase N-terminal domain-containing protein [Bacteroidota bacterium]